MADPFAFRNQRRIERQAAQDAATAGGGKKNKNRGGGGGNNRNNRNNQGKDPKEDKDNELASATNLQTWNEQPLSYLEFLGQQAGLGSGSSSFNNFANSLYTDIENQYNNAMATYKNNDLDFTDWLKRQDQYGNPAVSNANKDPNLKNVDSFGDYVERKYYGASAQQRGLDTVGYGAGSTRWSAF